MAGTTLGAECVLLSALSLPVFFFAAAVFCQSAYTGKNQALVQCLVLAERVGAGTGLCKGLSVLIGGVGGSLVPGTIVAITGDFNSGLLSIVVGALCGVAILSFLARAIKY